MIYKSKSDWMAADRKRVTLIGMSGLGKSYLSGLLRKQGGWFHYSVDYRIGTHYMGEHIADNFKREAMKVPFLAEHLMSDSIYIGSNITFDNLAPLSRYLGKPGDEAKGGISFDEYMRRQEQHREAEVAATCETVKFIERAERIYGYEDFVCDTSGSVCEVVDAQDRDDPVLTALAGSTLVIWLRGTAAHTETLVKRFDAAPKPMYTREAAMRARWAQYLADNDCTEAEVDPDSFIRWSYRQILDDRLPRYEAIAKNWGIAIDADAFQGVTSGEDFVRIVGDALPR